MANRTAVASLRFQSGLPSVLRHSRTRSLLSPPVRKRRSPQMTGVEPPLPGSGSFQTRLLVSLHCAGRRVSREIPLLSGPRPLGPFSGSGRAAPLSRRAQTAEQPEPPVQRGMAAFLKASNQGLDAHDDEDDQISIALTDAESKSLRRGAPRFAAVSPGSWVHCRVHPPGFMSTFNRGSIPTPPRG